MNDLKHFALTVLVALVSNFSAFAYDFEVDGIYYNITSSTDLTCEVTASSSWSNHNTYSGDIVIPSSVTYEGITYSVTSLDLCFDNCSNLTSVYIPASVTSFKWGNPFWLCTGLKSITVDSKNPSFKSVDGVLYNKAMTELIRFPSCNSITDFSIPNSVTVISDNAFTYCENLESVTIPNGVTEIKYGMFSNSKSLSDININSRNSNYSSVDGVVFNKTKSSILIYPSGRPSEEYTIPYGVTVIDVYAFDNSKLKSVVIPNGVTTIGRGAFNYCKQLNSVEMPNSLTEIGLSAFSGCSSLVSITIPENVIKIGTWAFMSCSNLTSVYYNAESCKMMGDDKHDADNYGVFKNCDALKEFHVGSNVKYIPYGAFGYDIDLDGVYIEDLSAWFNVKFESSAANPLYKAKDLYLNNQIVKDLVIPSDITKINDYAFSAGWNFKNGESLKTVTFPRNMKLVTIGNEAFSSCENIETVNIESLEAWCNIDFADMYSNPCFYSKGLTFNGSHISELVIPNSISIIKKYTFYNCQTITSVNFSNSVKEIQDYAFCGCKGINSLVLPKNIEALGTYAIPNSITSISLPKSLRTISSNAFGYGNLSSVYIEDLPSYCSLEIPDAYDNPLYQNSSVKLYIDNELVTDLVIPEGVKEVKPYAFYNCQALQSVTIPASMEKMGNNCFMNNPIQKVYISDLEAWCKIDFDGPQANPLFNRRSLYVNGVLTTEIIFPESLTEVKAGAFACSTITKVQLHENVNKIGDSAFVFSTLADINIPESVVEIGTQAFFQTPWRANNINYGSDGLCYINNVLFSCKSGTTTANIKIGTVSIAGDAFNSEYLQGYSNTSLKSVTIPNSVKTIGANAFYKCTSLTAINIPDGVEEIGTSAFYACEALQNITIPKTLKKVGNWAFYCSNNKTERNVYITDLVSWCNIDFAEYRSNPMQHYYSSYKGGGSNLYLNNKLIEKLVIPEDISEIKSNAFANCGSITSVILPNNLKSIGKEAFYQCFNLTSDLTIPYGIKRIEEASFCNSKLKNIILPKSIEYIGASAFWGDGELKSITLPYKLKTIEENAFRDCTNLTTVYNTSKIQLEKGSSDNGYVAYYANEIINIQPEVKVYNGNSDVVFVEGLEEAEAEATADNALVFAEIDEDNLPANYVVENEAKSIVITDAQPFYCPIDVEAETINYVRNFTSTNLQALYLPYAMSYDDWKDKAKVSYINDVHQFDDDDDGEIDRTVLEFISVKSGELAPNIPYLIKPLEKGETTFTSSNKTLKATLYDGYIDCSSTRMLYTLKGTYQTRDDIYANGYYAMSGGTFKAADNAGVTLSPFRVFLSITNRYGSGAVPRAKKITIMVDGVEEETTDIDEIMMSDAQPTEIYNLQGVRVDEGYKGIVIKNGKKVLVK